MMHRSGVVVVRMRGSRGVRFGQDHWGRLAILRTRSENFVDLSQQLAILRPRLLLIILVTVIAGVLSFGLASLIPKTYEAHATLLVGQVYDTSQPSQPPQLNYDAFLAS